MLADWTIWTAQAVWMISLLVRPKCSQRLAGSPMFSATLVVKATTSWLSLRCKELERKLNHDVVAFTTNVAENIGEPANRWLHFGLTSSDIIHTACAVQMVQSANILIEDVQALRKAIAAKARKYQFTPMMGRSHGIHAEPVTFGLKLALMYDEFGRALKRLQTARESISVGKLSGAVGTSAHLSPRV